MAEITIGPANAKAGCLDRHRPALQGGFTNGAPGDMADARCRRLGQFEGRRRVITIASEVNRLALRVRHFQAQKVGEIPKAFHGFRRQQLNMANMGDIL